MQSDFSWMVPIEVMLGSLNHGEVQACSISSVPDELRDPKEDAFKPTVVSIGPLHRGATRNLELMEQPKWHYMREFLNRTGSQEQTRSSELRLRECGMDILKLDKIVRASYGGNIESEPHDFAKIMMVDGCFQLELLIKLGNYKELQGNEPTAYSDDPILETEEKIVSVLNDITMLENQIPFIVLKKLYRKVFPDRTKIEDDHRVANIVRKAFGYPPVNNSGGAHILHLMHLSTVEQAQQPPKPAEQELLRCASRLRAAGVIIRPKPNSILIQHKLADRFNFEISFNERGELEIPPLHMKETTEVRWRNLIAWEQSRIWIRCKYTSYALFFQGLICCKHDIKMLEEIGVIVNGSKKSREDLLTVFRTISKGTEHMDSSYSKFCSDLNVYQRKTVTSALLRYPRITWHLLRKGSEIVAFYGLNWYRILIRDHIPTVWKFLGVVAAIILLVLTFIQTIYTVRSSH